MNRSPKTSITDRRCDQCGASYRSAVYNRLYCSVACRYQARKTTDTYAKDLAERRARYRPRPPRVMRVCSVDDCERKHLAQGLCALHYYREQRRQQRGSVRRRRTVVLDCVACLYGAAQPRVKRVQVRFHDDGGAVAWCPWCGTMLGCVTEAFRYCSECFTTVALNGDELSWVTSSQSLSSR